MWGRLRQVAYYVRPRLAPADVAWAHARLNADQQALFDAMAKPDRAHALRVARRLALQDAPAFALEAALLHDCGKPPGFGLVGRSLGVLLAGRAARTPSEPRQGGLEGMLQAYRWHDDWGLAAALAAGTSAEALALLRHEANTPWAAALQAADDAG